MVSGIIGANGEKGAYGERKIAIFGVQSRRQLLN